MQHTLISKMHPSAVMLLNMSRHVSGMNPYCLDQHNVKQSEAAAQDMLSFSINQISSSQALLRL